VKILQTILGDTFLTFTTFTFLHFVLCLQLIVGYAVGFNQSFLTEKVREYWKLIYAFKQLWQKTSLDTILDEYIESVIRRPPRLYPYYVTVCLAQTRHNIPLSQ